ncbi:MAG: hypothetical protein B6245_13460 [Desulfobacteraceae bacterium 4572_88]|nr:MAG: hypothetical protein B6245_13460 [Desulfobacteraceae bacterium 4572_88]
MNLTHFMPLSSCCSLIDIFGNKENKFQSEKAVSCQNSPKTGHSEKQPDPGRNDSASEKLSLICHFSGRECRKKGLPFP